MPTTDKFKRTVPLVDGPENSDAPANIQAAFENYSKSDGGFIRVSSKAEADQIGATAPDDTKCENSDLAACQNQLGRRE